ncbi:hypothetical protein E0H72_26420 [Rhizobium leguminosarum bv. viciae]|uniref:hypothetical protein n=1 Tax=Rhizobium leguminosarum TaxID=384 RepID=UPI00103E0D10|nr:hypothetical protein [Rhizobium leguminosarum]TCA38496.1 hypothetical protein E0H72_26420 [Rhizobium leguminosarum bv. viciae]
MMLDDVEQIDPVLSEDGKSVVFYAWTADPEDCFVWSVNLPVVIEEDAFLVEEWREAGWQTVMQQA